MVHAQHAKPRSPGRRIAIAIQSLDKIGGKERDALAIAGGLAGRGHAVTIVSRSVGLPIPAGIAVRALGSHGWTNHSRARQFARRIAALRGDFDAVLSFDKLKDADAYYAADVCLKPALRGIKPWLPRYATYARLEAECLGHGGPDLLFLCRKQETEYRREYALDDDRVRVLPPMIHDSGHEGFYQRRSVIRQKFGIPNTAVLAVSVAVYPRQKGIDRTIEAMRYLPDLQFLAVGLKDIAPIRTKAESAGVLQRCHLVGYSDEVGDILGAADLMLHPARLENTGLVILESLLAGVPVIASANCGFAEYIERFGAGLVLSEPFDRDRYASAIRTALDPEKLAGLKLRAQASAPRLRAEGGIERILDVVELVLQRRSR